MPYLHKWKDQIFKQIHLRPERVFGIGAGERSFVSVLGMEMSVGDEQPAWEDADKAGLHVRLL